MHKQTEKKERCRHRTARQDQRLPITIDILHRIIPALNSVYLNQFESNHFRVEFLLAFYGFLRIGEITAQSRNGSSRIQHWSSYSTLRLTNLAGAALLQYRPLRLPTVCHASSVTPFWWQSCEAFPIYSSFKARLAIYGPARCPLHFTFLWDWCGYFSGQGWHSSGRHTTHGPLAVGCIAPIYPYFT